MLSKINLDVVCV